MSFSSAISIASVNAPLQASIAVSFGGNYALALALVAGPGAVVIVILTALGVEAKGAVFGTAQGRGAADPLVSAALSLN